MDCRGCGGAVSDPILDLGQVPLANGLLETAAAEVLRYPLRLVRCPACSLVQLDADLPPEQLYGNYPFRSGVNRGFTEHCRELARWVLPLAEELDSHRLDVRLLDIGCNDGTLLRAFAQEGVHPDRLIGVDLWPCIEGLGCETIAGEMPAATRGLPRYRADVITILNVLNAVREPQAVLAEVARLLSPSGLVIVEVPYVVELVQHAQFDAIYHEHRTYWHVTALDRIAHRAGLMVVSAEWVATQGGSIRAILAHRGMFPHAPGIGVWRWWEERTGIESGGGFGELAYRVHERKCAFLDLLRQHLPDAGVPAFGASAKATTLASQVGLDAAMVPWVADDTAAKQGKFLPWGPAIVPAEGQAWADVPVVLNFAWNAEGEVGWRLAQLGFRGELLAAFPRAHLTSVQPWVTA